MCEREIERKRQGERERQKGSLILRQCKESKKRGHGGWPNMKGEGGRWSGLGRRGPPTRPGPARTTEFADCAHLEIRRSHLI